MNINNLQDFLKARMCSEENFEQVKRNTYKYTDCGAWIEQDKEGISVGSIVEGSDWGVNPIKLNYPFQIKEFWNALDEVEKEAKEIWNDTHGCEDCNLEHPEYGTAMVNPDCKTCDGYGVII